MDLQKQLYELEQISKNLMKQIETIKKNIPLSDSDKYNINRSLSLCKNRNWSFKNTHDDILNVSSIEFYKNNINLGIKLYTGYNLKHNIFPGVFGTSYVYFKKYILNSKEQDEIIHFINSLEWNTINKKNNYKNYNPINKSIDTINLQLVLFDLFYNEHADKYIKDINIKSTAVNNYCQFHKKNVKDVNIEEVSNSSAGIEGWYNYSTNLNNDTFNISPIINLYDIINNKNNLYSGYYNNYTIDIYYKKDDKIEWREKCLLIDNIDNHKKIKVKHNNIIKTLFVKNIKDLKNLKKYEKTNIDDEISMITNKFKDVDFKKRKIK